MRILALTYERNWELDDWLCGRCGIPIFETESYAGIRHIHNGSPECYIEVMGADGKKVFKSIGLALPSPKIYHVEYTDNAIQGSVKAGFTPDLIIEREFNDGKAIYTSLLKSYKDIPKAFWFIDAHVSPPERYQYCKNFDFVFVAHSPYIDKVKEVVGHNNVFWLPLCYPYRSDQIKTNYQMIKHEVSFVGRWGKMFPERTKMIEELTSRLGKKFHAVTDYDNMLTIIKQSKVSTNHSIKDDLNFRVFEVLGSGTELVTNYVPDLFNIKDLADKCHVYQDFDHMEVIINSILTNDPEFTKDTLKTQAWIRDNHTMKQRLESMLRMIASKEQEEF